MLQALLDPGIDPINDTLEMFYGFDRWPNGNKLNPVILDQCGATRGKYGKVKCTQAKWHLNSHRGFGKDGRVYCWTEGAREG